MDGHPVWSKRCSIHPDIRNKKTSANSTTFPLLGGEMGRGMEKYGNMALMLEFLDDVAGISTIL
jgi:hypothetical protein